MVKEGFIPKEGKTSKLNTSTYTLNKHYPKPRIDGLLPPIKEIQYSLSDQSPQIIPGGKQILNSHDKGGLVKRTNWDGSREAYVLQPGDRVDHRGDIHRPDGRILHQDGSESIPSRHQEKQKTHRPSFLVKRIIDSNKFFYLNIYSS